MPAPNILSIVKVRQPWDLPDDAMALLTQAEAVNVEFGLNWYKNLVQTVYSEDLSVSFYVLNKDGAAVAVVPLRFDRRMSFAHIKSLSNFYTALYEPAFSMEVQVEDVAHLFKAIRDDIGRVGSLRFSPMNPSSRAFKLVREACQVDGWRVFDFFCFGNWFLRVNLQWPEYYKARAGEVRNTIKRMGKKLAEAGGTTEVVSKPEALPAALAAYAKVYAASWKVPEPFEAFVPGLLHTFAEKGWLRLGLVWINGEAVAAQIWIIAHGRAEIYKLAYDESYKKFSPGTLLTTLLMEQVFVEGKVVEIDYLIGDDPYKRAWMDQRRERWGLIAYNPRTLGGLVAWLKEAAGRGIKALMSSNKTDLGG